eukprot:75290-Hanusia_phi.AAC.3
MREMMSLLLHGKSWISCCELEGPRGEQEQQGGDRTGGWKEIERGEDGRVTGKEMCDLGRSFEISLRPAWIRFR